MQRTANPALDRLILDHLSNKYKLKEKREGIHLSTLVYCLTRSYFDQTIEDAVDPTDEELLLFSLGYGLQEVLTPTSADTPTFEKDGIVYRPDMTFDPGNFTLELKTTRQSLKKAKISLPETWIEYIMGGCYIRNIRSYELAGLYMMGSYSPPFPEIYCETLSFDKFEITNNWQYIIGRRDVYRAALEQKEPPQPFVYNKEWECKNCRYLMQCQTTEMIRERGRK
jgi:hypothetical protein